MEHSLDTQRVVCLEKWWSWNSKTIILNKVKLKLLEELTVAIKLTNFYGLNAFWTYPQYAVVWLRAFLIKNIICIKIIITKLINVNKPFPQLTNTSFWLTTIWAKITSTWAHQIVRVWMSQTVFPDGITPITASLKNALVNLKVDLKFMHSYNLSFTYNF